MGITIKGVTSYGIKTVTDGLVLYLDAANTNSYPGTGTTWYDLSGNGNHGTLTNGPTFNTSGYFIFDGINDYVVLTRPTQIVTGGEITIFMFVSWTTSAIASTTYIQALVDNKHNGSPVQGFIIQDRPDQSGLLSFSTLSNYPTVQGVYSTFKVGDNTWRNVVALNDGTYSKFYINGTYNNQVNGEPGLSTVQPNISIGRSELYGRYLNGKISLISIYNRALTQQEITQNFNALKSRYGL